MKPRISMEFNHNFPHEKVLKILGVTYQENLSWTTHIDNICKKANQRIYILRKMKNMVTKEQLVEIYNGIILSILEYNGPLFIEMTKTLNLNEY